MKKMLYILIVLVVIVIIVAVLSNKLLIKDLSTPQITSVDSVFFTDIQVEPHLFKAKIILGTSTDIVSDCNIEINNRKIIITIYSHYFMSENEGTKSQEQISYRTDMSQIDSIVVKDTTRQKVLWDRQQGIVW